MGLTCIQSVYKILLVFTDINDHLCGSIVLHLGALEQPTVGRRGAEDAGHPTAPS